MIRREFITGIGGGIVWLNGARGQPSTVWQIGYLSGRSLESEEPLLVAFREGLAHAGHSEVQIHARFAEGQDDRLPAFAAELVQSRAAVLIATDRPSAVALKEATKTIPVVFASGVNPIDAGLVTSLNRPDGNLTGVNIFTSELGPKRLELLRELVPSASLIGFLVNPTDASAPFQMEDIQRAANSARQQLLILDVSTQAGIDAALGTATQSRVGAIMYSANRLFQIARHKLIALAARYSIPAVYEWPEFVRDGGLASYSADRTETYRQVGTYAGRILNGSKPSDLPVVQATKFQLVLNLKTANALTLTIPPTLLARADEVIE